MVKHNRSINNKEDERPVISEELIKAAKKAKIEVVKEVSLTDWSKVQFFKPAEFFGFADKIKPELIYALDALRKICGRPIRINNAYRAEDPGSTHVAGEAADIVIEGLHVVDQYLIAEKMGLFTGIGAYRWWNRPGLHVDVRKLALGEIGHRWIRDVKGNYIALNSINLRTILS